VAWETFENKQYAEAASFFARAGCSPEEKVKYSYYAGVSYLLGGNYEMGKRLLIDLVALPSASEEIGEGLGVSYSTASFAAILEHGSKKGDVLYVKHAVNALGKSFKTLTVAWVDDAGRKDPENPFLRTYVKRDAQSSAEAYALFCLARAYAAANEKDKAKDLLERRLPLIQGTFWEDGKIGDLHKAAEELLKSFS
jgi:tetratricopeptide (TPR) repeat protein